MSAFDFDSTDITNTIFVTPFINDASIPNKYENVILDMDGTLLDNIPPKLQDPSYKHIKKNTIYQPIARPHLKDFLEYVFRNFKRVSIWTAGTKEWYEQCYGEVLRHYIPEGKSFDFVLTREDFQRYYPVKPLSFVYKTHPEYNSTNTLIVDDNPVTYSENVENAIGIKSFFFDLLTKEQRGNLNCHDFELLKIVVIMDKMLSGEKVCANPISEMMSSGDPFASQEVCAFKPLPDSIILKTQEDEWGDLYT